MTNEIVVMYGLMGIVVPMATKMPPTVAVCAKTIDSSGTQTGEAVTLIAAAAGTRSRASTSKAPTTCTETATAQPTAP